VTGPFFFDSTEILGPRRMRKRGGSKQAPTRGPGGCEECGLWRNCKSPKMGPYGKNELRIAIVGMQPGRTEDKKGRPFVGDSGDDLRSGLERLGIYLDEDCTTLNAIQCFSDKHPSDQCRLFCLPRLDAQLKESRPNLIVCLGTEAVSSVMGRSIPVTKIRGRPLVSGRYKSWVLATYHPAYIMRQEKQHVKDDLAAIWNRDLEIICDLFDRDVHSVLLDEGRGNHWVTDVDEAIELLGRMAASEEPVAFDYETNQLSLFTGDPKALLLGLANSKEEGFSILIPDPIPEDLHNAIATFLTSSVPKLAQNSMFEGLWSRKIFGVCPQNVYRDTMLAAHLLDDRRGTKGLDWLTFMTFGSEYKQEFKKNSGFSPQADAAMATYNCLDVRYTVALSEYQERKLSSHLIKGELLYQKSVPMLADMTWNGIKVSVERLEALRVRARATIQESERQLLSMPAIKDTEITTRRLFSFSDDDQRTLFYKVLGLSPVVHTKVDGLASIGIDALRESAVGNDAALGYVECLAARSEWSKHLTTYIEPFLALRDSNDMLHPSFTLHIARSYRSSSKGPNAQNIPHRGQFASEVRSCIIPQYDYLLERDYSGMEVRIVASVSGDINLITDLENNVDLHRLWASRIYEIPEDEITDEQRFIAKSDFVFAKFYGQNWKMTCNPPLSMPSRKARRLDRMFWKRYEGVSKWQAKMVEQYRRKGYVELVSGFRRYGPLDILQIGNTPVQGAAFHVLLENGSKLWREMNRRKMTSHMIAEIHDSLVFDIVEDEVEEIVELGTDILDELPGWLPNAVPLTGDWSIGTSWGSMEKI